MARTLLPRYQLYETTLSGEPTRLLSEHEAWGDARDARLAQESAARARGDHRHAYALHDREAFGELQR